MRTDCNRDKKTRVCYWFGLWAFLLCAILATDSAAKAATSDYYQLATSWGLSGTGDGQFNYPYGIAVDKSGNVFVADTYNHRIQKFDSIGNFKAKWGSYGTDTGYFNNPYGVAVDASGHVFVADTDNHRIQKFDSDGNFITMWGSVWDANKPEFYHPLEDGYLYGPKGVAIDASGNVLVADTGYNRIQIFDSSGNFLSKWGSYSGISADGYLNQPKAVAVDSSGYVYVADSSHTYYIQKFDSNGAFQGTLGTGNGYGDGFIMTPTGVAVNSAGDVYVVSGGGRIQIFDSQGVFKVVIGDGAGGIFKYAAGVAVDTSGYVYVSDISGNQVKKFVKLCAVDGDEDNALKAAKNYEGLPEETKAIMENGCFTDEEKLNKITDLVKGWLNEYHISKGDLKNYIIPSIVVTKDLENGYKIFDSLPNSKGTGTSTVTPYFLTLADSLRKQRLTSYFVDKIDDYCRVNDMEGNAVILRKILFLCGTTISAPKNIDLFVTAVCRNVSVEENVEETKNYSKEVREMADKVLSEAFGSPVSSFLSFFVEGLLDFIPVGKIVTVLKKGYDLFGNASEVYKDMQESDVVASTYKYHTDKDYQAIACVMKVPNAAVVQIIISRQQEKEGKYQADGKGLIVTLPFSIRTGGSNDAPEYLVLDYNTKSDLYKKAKEYLKKFEEKGYTKAKRIDYYDFEKYRYRAVAEF